MQRGFAIEAAEVAVVSSVKDYQNRVSRSKGERPPVLKNAREMFEGVPPAKTVSEAVKEKP